MTLAVRWAAAQNDQILQVFLSNEQKRDPAQMEATQMFKVGDPIYFVLVIDPKNNIKVGDLVSTNPTTKEKNVFICFQLASSTMENTCPGLLKAPFSQEVLNGKSIVYPIIPATNDVNAVNMDEIRAILKGFQSMYGTVDLKVILKHFDSNGNVILECEVDLDGWNTSRWREYLSLFLTRDNAAQKERDLIASDSKPLPQSKLNDPALEKEITLQSPILFGPKYRIYKAVINQSNWEYVKNEFGILLYRRIYLAVMMKNVESGECMIDYEAIAREDYLHGNVYDKVYLALPHVRDRSLVRCERFVGFK
jgi:hypothetical protein